MAVLREDAAVSLMEDAVGARELAQRLARDLEDAKNLQRIASLLIEVPETIERLGEKIARHFGVPWCLFIELREDLEVSATGYSWNAPDAPPLQGTFRLREIFSDLQLAAALRGEPSIVRDARTDPEAHAESFGAPGVVSYVIVPWVRHRVCQSLLCILDRQVRSWREDEIELLRELAERMWMRRERDHAEQALRHSEARLRTLADAVPQLIWTNRCDGTADYFNRRWYDYTGLSFDQSYGLGWEAVVHPDDARCAKQAWARARAAGEVFDCEYRLRGAGDTYRWFIGRNVPMKDAAGGIAGWFGSATDIQDLKEAQAELQEADRQKNHFLALLGHELRNPLAAIRHGVTLLRSAKARPESRAAALPIVAEQVAYMEHLVDDLLDLSRIVQGSVQVRREPMAIQYALEQALEMVRPQAKAGGFTIDLHVSATPLEVLGDRVRLTQVFMNVLGNAVKYSGDSRLIEVSAAREDDAAVVRIRDYGVGIAAELLPRIFEPFVQASCGSTLHSGLGLGLAVVRQLVHLHDGEIQTYSEGERQGSEFVLRFPLRSPPPP